MEMMRAFAAHGYEVYALGNEPAEKWGSRFAENGVTYRQIEVSRNGVSVAGDLHTLSSIKKQLREIMPEKIFTFQAKTVIYGVIAARSLGITEVYPLIAGVGSVFLSGDLKSKIVRRIIVAEYKYALKKCSTVFFQNMDDVETFESYKIVRRENVVMLHGSGVDTEKFAVTPLPEKPAFLCISRLIRDKGVCEYLDAARELKKKYPETRCLLVGPFDTNPSAIKPEELQPYIDDGTIEYFGEQEDVRPYIDQSSVYVLPSYREGTPKTVLEAMSCGRAVITTDAAGCRETTTDGVNGFLVPVKDVAAIVEKMEYFITHPDVISEMGAKGRALAESTFDVRKVNKTICQSMKL